MLCLSNLAISLRAPRRAVLSLAILVVALPGWRPFACGTLDLVMETAVRDRRRELGAFLRSRRARLSPAEVGLPDWGVRRVPGLRREEVAQLANIGLTWYTWLEQGRQARPSASVLTAIADALRLDSHEREYLFALARSPDERAGRGDLGDAGGSGGSGGSGRRARAGRARAGVRASARVRDLGSVQRPGLQPVGRAAVRFRRRAGEHAGTRFHRPRLAHPDRRLGTGGGPARRDVPVGDDGASRRAGLDRAARAACQGLAGLRAVLGEQ